MTMSATSKNKTYLYKINLNDMGKISFFKSSSKTNSNTKMYLLDSNGKTLVSKTFKDFVKLILKVSKKGAYYIKINLKKNQSVSGFGYKFISSNDNSSSKSSGWVKDYKLKQDDIDRITRVAEFLCLGRLDDGCFKEGSLTEQKAMQKLVSYCSFIRYYSDKNDSQYMYTFGGTASDPYSDPLERFIDHFWVKKSIVDGVLYDLFGIKASHKYNSDSFYYIYNDNYYFPHGAGGGGYSSLQYLSKESLQDGRFIVKYGICDLGYGGYNYSGNDIYLLISVHKSNEKYLPRIHAISHTRSGFNK